MFLTQFLSPGKENKTGMGNLLQMQAKCDVGIAKVGLDNAHVNKMCT